MKKLIGSILSVFPSLLTLFLALSSWDTYLRFIGSGWLGVTDAEVENISSFNSGGIWIIIISIALAAIGIALMSKGKKVVVRVVGGLLILASSFTIIFNSAILFRLNLTLGRIVVVIELLAIITGIVLLFLSENKK